MIETSTDIDTTEKTLKNEFRNHDGRQKNKYVANQGCVGSVFCYPYTRSQYPIPDPKFSELDFHMVSFTFTCEQAQMKGFGVQMCLLTVSATGSWSKMAKILDFPKHGYIRDSQYPFESGGGWGLITALSVLYLQYENTYIV